MAGGLSLRESKKMLKTKSIDYACAVTDAPFIMPV